MIAYEIQTYNGGQWQIQAIFDDKELALLEARRLRAGRPSLAVRVVEEAYDDARRTSASRVVFRESPVDGHHAEVVEGESQTRWEAEAWRSRKAAEKIRRPAAKEVASEHVRTPTPNAEIA